MFDIAGVTILVVLIVVFGFLTLRAWKAKSRWLKWMGALLSGLLTLVSAALLILALTGFYKLNQHFDNPITEVSITASPQQIARGAQLANICVSCHTPGSQMPLSGSNFAAKFDFPPLGALYAPNLTPSGNIADWTDGEVIRAIREGVDRNGRSLLIMPSANFRHMSDEDVQALVAYLRSQPAAGEPTPDTQFNLLGAIFMNLADFRVAQPPVGHVAAPSAETSAYGKYMVDVIGCRDCHGDQLQGKLASGQPGPPPGPNLTQLMPQWTEEEFMTFFNTGTLPGGGTVPILTLKSGFTESKMPWEMVRAASTDAELKAMFTYLHTLSPVQGPTP
ncbi:MAG: cytochrome c [Anaerolineales bacterium]|nr:cytochrome c [Anaerolineales bacterium]